MLEGSFVEMRNLTPFYDYVEMRYPTPFDVAGPRLRSQRRSCGQSYWLGFLCNTLSFSVSNRSIPALLMAPFNCLPHIDKEHRPCP